MAKFALLTDGQQNYINNVTLSPTLSTSAVSFGGTFTLGYNQPALFPHLISLGGGDSGCIYFNNSGGAPQGNLAVKFNSLGGSTVDNSFINYQNLGYLAKAMSVIAVYDGAHITLYINGVSVGTPDAVTGSIVWGANNSFGVGQQPDNAYNGAFAQELADDCFVYNRGLSATEVSTIVGSQIYPSNGLVVLWHFNEGTGTTTADSSGNGNSGTLQGTPPPTWLGVYPVNFVRSNSQQPVNADSIMETW